MNNCMPTDWITNEMNKFPRKHKIYTGNHKEIGNLNAPITTKATESFLNFKVIFVHPCLVAVLLTIL